MANIELKKSIYRIFADLIKSDNVISVTEMDILSEVEKHFEITDKIRTESYSMSLADAANNIAIQKPLFKNKIIKMMENSSLRDGECCREEALLISAMEIECKGNGYIISMPSNNRPILSTQILFVDSTYAPKKNDLDRNYEEISIVVEMAGFELVYIPQIAKNFKEFKRSDELKRLLSIINPTLNESILANKVMSLQNMDSRYFYIQVLNGKLEMGLNLTEPAWLIRLPNSIVNGKDYANFLCFNVEMNNIIEQLKNFIADLNRRQNPYSVIVNRHSDRSKDFLYSGFHKALLDVMASEKVDSWEVRIYVRAGAAPVIDESKTGKKFTVEFRKGEQSFPVNINGREAAFYLLLLCGTAGPNHSIDFGYEREKSKIVQLQYEAAYHLVSNRSEHFPDITLSSTFRPIKAKVLKGLEECGVKGDIYLFKPTKIGKDSYYIPINPENVRIISSEGSTPLTDSSIFREFYKILSQPLFR